MALQRAFDYYAELGLGRQASTGEVRAAYRRLALRHHPDKNHGNGEEATVKFQRINEAAQVLMDEAKRRGYDAQTGLIVLQAYGCDSDERASDRSSECGGWDDLTGHLEEYRMWTMFPRFSRWVVAQEWFRDRAARAEEEQKAKAARREAKERAAEQDRECLRSEEAEAQARVWEQCGAVSPEQRREHCLHSSFCNKKLFRKKFECTSCGARRGVVGFQCPYCDRLICQLCLDTFTRKRAAEKQRQVAAESCPTTTSRTTERPGGTEVGGDGEQGQSASQAPPGSGNNQQAAGSHPSSGFASNAPQNHDVSSSHAATTSAAEPTNEDRPSHIAFVKYPWGADKAEIMAVLQRFGPIVSFTVVSGHNRGKNSRVIAHVGFHTADALALAIAASPIPFHAKPRGIDVLPYNASRFRGRGNE